MEIEIISRECIKPSSPTPHHLRTHKISLVDQFGTPMFVSTINFYLPNQVAGSVSKRSQVLKQSLSKTLTLYYPVAGKIIDTLSIDCNDEGVSYMVARVNCNLRDYLRKPDLSKLPKFVPGEIIASEMTLGAHVAMIQETVFACGGFSIGLVIPHHFFDGNSTIVFLKNWATIARQEAPQAPDFSSSYMFPQNTSFPQDPISSTVGRLVFGQEGTFVLRRFVFEGLAVSNLKAKATRSGVPNPTRVEVVVALLLKCIMSALSAKSPPRKSALISTTVNLRRRVVPPFPETTVGNLVLLTPILANSEETDSRSFLHLMSESISPINGEFLKSLQGDQGLQRLSEYVEELRESFRKASSDGAETIVFNSWCNSGIYNADFGWGKPIWFPAVASALPLRGSVIQLTDTRMSNGIEAWVSLDEEIMSMVEHDEELLSIASVDPSPLEIDSLKSKL
ncbi:stemmadenine O-acetyltransferase-like [Tripterygium wilfordii]|uniref:stemmadenine O-acetyltransferase-like n=1 Tax=Tripterygium wilfordii TaxID=458696 RepID=UPI0018F853C4|nr:stemmadenine O-acetyltransferase-like [Tripterygium wilfordii]